MAALPLPLDNGPRPVALITAGTAGLGAAAAKLFVSSGYRVALTFKSDAKRAQSLAAELGRLEPEALADRREGPLVVNMQSDLGERAEIYAMVPAAAEKLGGRIDVVFSNGGWTHFRDINDLDDNVDEADWDTCFNMNVKSHLWLMHAARPFLDRSEGAFITTASLAGVKVSGSSLAYAVTKAAQIHLVKGLAKIAGPKIRVNSVSPGLLLTDWGLKFPEETREKLREQTVLKSLATVEDVARQVLLFAQSRSVTGTNAVIDGGVAL